MTDGFRHYGLAPPGADPEDPDADSKTDTGPKPPTELGDDVPPRPPQKD